MSRGVLGKEAEEWCTDRGTSKAKAGMLQGVSHSQPPPPDLGHSLTSHECSGNISGMESIITCAALGKSLALSEIQLSSVAGGLITLTFQDYARLQFPRYSST